jgi:hypothetical protein
VPFDDQEARMSDFDRDLYDEVMSEADQVSERDRKGFHYAAEVAARIAAERQSVSDEELDRIFWYAHMSNLQGTTDSSPGEPERYRGVRAVRAALRTPVPRVTEAMVDAAMRRYVEYGPENARPRMRGSIQAALTEADRQPVAVIPEGWKCYNATFVPAEIAHDGVAWYRATIGKADYSASTEGTGPTWHDALNAAIAKIEKDGDHE